MSMSPPRTPVDRILFEIWSDLRCIEPIGVHDNFFSLGGDSILSIQVAERTHSQGLSFAPKVAASKLGKQRRITRRR
ncbi:MAG: phosphopantetheine-binding protein [Methylococcales bacterium]